MSKLTAKSSLDLTTSNSKPVQPDSLIGGGQRVRSEDLFAGGKEVVIEHRDETYRLRLTAQGKLILTK
ncbi:MAG TPA: hemin uptake protein HemP [Methylophilaceae bacterium]|jgi:hemin uptake protein HemP